MRVELDKNSLFALASDTRMEILKSLQPMRRTISQLSEAIGIDKAAVHRHLKKLENGGLVKRHEDHGFVYYGLSWKARDLMSPKENTKIVILISCSWLMAFSAFFIIFLGVVLLGVGGAAESAPDDFQQDQWPTYYTENPLQENKSGQYAPADSDELSNWVIPSAGLVSGSLIFALLAIHSIRKPKQESL